VTPRDLDLRLAWIRNLAMLAVAERDGLPQHEQLRKNSAEIKLALADVPPPPLAQRLGLTAVQANFFWAAVAVSADPLLAVHVEALGGSSARRGLSVSLFARLVGLDAAPARELAAWLAVSNPLVEGRLVVASDDAAPAVRTYGVPSRVIAHLAGDDTPEPGVVIVEAPVAATLVLDDAQRSAVETLARVILGESSSLVILEGPRGTGRTSAIAHAAGGPVVEIDLATSTQLAAGRREATLRDRPLVLANVDRATDVQQLALRDQLQLHRGVVIVTASVLGAQLPLDRPTIRVRWPVPSTTTRRQLWTQMGAAADGIDALAHRYRIGPGTIARAIESARLLGGAAATLDTASLTTGLRHNISEELGGLAQRVEVTQTWDDLVLAEDTRDQVDALIARVRHAHKVLEDWDYRGKMARGTGVPALFSGPPGTGKTMVAGLIARALDLELYQVDLSQVISKWVGETEKQLARVFDAAEQGHGLLLFDEADALFGQRTSEVKGAVDRYANLEVNYLLQRVEAFGGITILTTNLDAGIDRALKRRLAGHVVFGLPDEDERVALWRRLTATSRAPLDPALDFGQLSRAFPRMSGANIRNAALAAAFLAAADGATTITQAHLVRAARSEYRSMGHELASVVLT